MAKKSLNRKQLDKQILDLWSDRVIERDKSCCLCGSTFRLSSHHIVVRSHMATRYLLENGIALCWACHSKQKFRPQDFFDSIIDLIGWDYYNSLKERSKEVVKYSIADLLEIKERLK